MGLLYRPEFIYFPSFLVQTGKPILFGTEGNFSRFIKMHRCGRLQSHYASLMEQSMGNPEPGTAKYLIQSFLNHKDAENLRVVEREFDDERFREAELLRHEHVKAFAPFFVGRLHSKIISETEIVSKLVENEELFQEHPPARRVTVRNVALGSSHLREETIAAFLEQWKTNSKLLRFRISERYYDREMVEDILGQDHPLRVNGLTENLPLGNKADITRLEHDREVNILFEWVKSNPQGLDAIPRALIRDDNILLSGRHLTIPRLLIVSDDMDAVHSSSNLRSFNWRESRETFHISVEDWILSDMLSGRDFSPDEVFVDTGSLDGYLDNLDRIGVDYPEPDGQGIRGRYRPIRPTSKMRLPSDVVQFQLLRAEIESRRS
jgi:hypothetical protein